MQMLAKDFSFHSIIPMMEHEQGTAETSLYSYY